VRIIQRNAQEDTMTAPNPTPTPNSMPGATPPASGNPQLQEPIPTGTPPPAPQPPAPAPADPVQTPPPAPPATDDKEDKTDWKAHARTWEQRAKDNADAAKKWEEAEAAKRTQAENDRIAIQQANDRAKLAEENLARERVARTTGVEPEFLGGGTEEEMRATAARLLEWRGPQQGSPPAPPPPQTAAVPASTVTSGAVPIGTSPNGVQQLTKEQFVALPQAERMAAVRAGQCTNLGVGKPQEHRRMGNEIEVSAHGGRQ
jgi:hypothetical protein